MKELIATTSLSGVTRTGQTIAVEVQVGRPNQLSGEAAECLIAITGVEKTRIIYGDDPLQALCLALCYGHFLVGEFIKSGGRLFFQDDQEQNALTADILFPLCHSHLGEDPSEP